MRIGIAGINHETNSYCRDQTTADEFWLVRGDEVHRLAGTATDLGGMLAGCAELGATPVCTLHAGAQPSGIIAADAYERFKEEILVGLDRAGELDAVFLSLHGAGIVDGIDDLEADLSWAVRDLVGHDTPIVAVFDLHGNVSQHMADALSVGLACHEYPHTDFADRGLEAVRLLPGLVRGDLRPTTHVESVPALLPTTTTLFGPAKEVLDYCRSLEEYPGVVDCSFFHGFPYTDTPLVGSHFVVTTDDDADLARRLARDAATFLWDRIETFAPETLSADQAIARAATIEGRPVVINETSDNPGGGAPGDGTHLLRALVDAGTPNACFGFLCDPLSAAAAHAAGVGATVTLDLGGRYDDLHGSPLRVDAYVKALHDGHFPWQRMFRGVDARLGPMARIDVNGLDVIIASNRSQTFDPEVFAQLGVDVLRYDIVALKSSNHFRAGFQDLAAGIVTADTPGLTTHRIEVFPREKAPGPLWPLDPSANYVSA